MQITKYEKTAVPQTPEGRKFADDYEEHLRAQGAFDNRSEGTKIITISAIYYYILEDKELLHD